MQMQKLCSVELIKLGEELGLLTRGGNGLSMKMEGREMKEFPVGSARKGGFFKLN